MTAGIPPITEAEGRKMMPVLGKVEGELAASFTTELFWVVREDDGRSTVHNGSAFFLDTGTAVFGVTASHVIDDWRRDRNTRQVVAFQMGDLPFEPEGKNAVIAAHTDIDIATFTVTREEIAAVGKTILTGSQSEWPPKLPWRDRAVYYAGCPGVEREWLSPNEISFGVIYGGGTASSVSDTDIQTLIERQHIIPVVGGRVPPEKYKFGGISGGPMLFAVEHKGLLRLWALAGVICEGPHPSDVENEAGFGMEIIRARPAHFIKADGTLDVQRWDSNQSMQPKRRGG